MNNTERTDTNQEAFFELVRAGLWEKKVLLSEFNNIDYEAIMEMAEEQSVVGLVTAGMEHIDVRGQKEVVRCKPSQEMMLQFVGETLQIEQQNKDMNEFVAWLIDLLRKADVCAILLKVQGIAQCYERPLWRASGDVDLLLSDSNYEKAKKVLLPLATEVETEYTHFKHQGMTINGFVVELHGTQHSRLSRRVDRMIDEVQKDVFYGGNVRSWQNGNTQVLLSGVNDDVIFVFTHILHHFFFEGIGLRQICDWCRLLWTYRDSLDYRLLESRLRKAGLMTEWKAFAAFAVDWLGMPVKAMPLYDENDRSAMPLGSSKNQNEKLKRKAERIKDFVLEVGNFGHKQRRDYSGQPYLLRKIKSSFGRFSDMLRHFSIFPKDSIVFFGGVLRSGLYAAVRGE